METPDWITGIHSPNNHPVLRTEYTASQCQVLTTYIVREMFPGHSPLSAGSRCCSWSCSAASGMVAVTEYGERSDGLQIPTKILMPYGVLTCSPHPPPSYQDRRSTAHSACSNRKSFVLRIRSNLGDARKATQCLGSCVVLMVSVTLYYVGLLLELARQFPISSGKTP